MGKQRKEVSPCLQRYLSDLAVDDRTPLPSRRGVLGGGFPGKDVPLGVLRSNPSLLPPPTPVDVVDDNALWSAFGLNTPPPIPAPRRRRGSGGGVRGGGSGVGGGGGGPGSPGGAAVATTTATVTATTVPTAPTTPPPPGGGDAALMRRRGGWIGHGRAWRPTPLHWSGDPPLENAAGNAMNDFDLLEDGFSPLAYARVLCADYDLLRLDFPQLEALSCTDIDAWLLKNAAYMSEGQAKRLQKKGDHYQKLGLSSYSSGAEAAIGPTGGLVGVGSESGHTGNARKKGAIRMRSGGRAATFLVEDSYSINTRVGVGGGEGGGGGGR